MDAGFSRFAKREKIEGDVIDWGFAISFAISFAIFHVIFDRLLNDLISFYKKKNKKLKNRVDMTNMTPELKLFFERLLALKEKINEYATKNSDFEIIEIADEINDLIKREGE